MLAEPRHSPGRSPRPHPACLDQEPFNGAYLDSLGWAYYKQNKLDQAEHTLRKAVERESHDPTIREHLGDVLAKQGARSLPSSNGKNP